jgi:DNA-binding FadR family transcriptional regulator
MTYAASGNRYLEEETRKLRNRLGPYRRYITFQPSRIPESLVGHQCIVNALLVTDEAHTHDQMRAHLDVFARDLANAIAALEDLSLRQVSIG